MWKVACPLPPKTSKLKESGSGDGGAYGRWGDTDEQDHALDQPVHYDMPQNLVLIIRTPIPHPLNPRAIQATKPLNPKL